MYVNTDNRYFMKCLDNDFTVLPFVVFFVKMVRLILYVNYNITNEVVVDCYFNLCLLLLFIKFCMVVIRKFNILNSTMELDKGRVKPLKNLY